MKHPRNYEVEYEDCSWQGKLALKNKSKQELVNLLESVQDGFRLKYRELLKDYEHIFCFHDQLIMKNVSYELQQAKADLEEWKAKADDYDIKALQAKIVRLA